MMAERRNNSKGELLLSRDDKAEDLVGSPVAPRSAASLQISNREEVNNFVPRRRVPLLNRNPPPKTTIAAVLLLVGGLFFISFGLSVMFSNVLKHGKDRGVALLVLGGIMFLPGSYASTIIYGTYMGWQGYDYSQVPSYDDYNG